MSVVLARLDWSGGACKSQETKCGIIGRQSLWTRYTLRHFQRTETKKTHVTMRFNHVLRI